jgi:hypothetical protein
MVVKRIIEPVVKHAQSPITARAIMLFLLLALVMFTIIHDFLQDRRSDRRHEEITQNQEEARVTRAELKEQAIVTTQAVDRLDATMSRFEKMTQGIADVAEILRSERTVRQKEYAAIQSVLKLHAKRTNSPQPLNCYELRRRVEKGGAADVIIIDLVKKPQCN